MGTRTYSRRGADGIRRPTKLGISTGKFTAPISEMQSLSTFYKALQDDMDAMDEEISQIIETYKRIPYWSNEDEEYVKNMIRQLSPEERMIMQQNLGYNPLFSWDVDEEGYLREMVPVIGGTKLSSQKTSKQRNLSLLSPEIAIDLVLNKPDLLYAEFSNAINGDTTLMYKLKKRIAAIPEEDQMRVVRELLDKEHGTYTQRDIFILYGLAMSASPRARWEIIREVAASSTVNPWNNEKTTMSVSNQLGMGIREQSMTTTSSLQQMLRYFSLDFRLLSAAQEIGMGIPSYTEVKVAMEDPSSRLFGAFMRAFTFTHTSQFTENILGAQIQDALAQIGPNAQVNVPTFYQPRDTPMKTSPIILEALQRQYQKTQKALSDTVELYRGTDKNFPFGIPMGAWSDSAEVAQSRGELQYRGAIPKQYIFMTKDDPNFQTNYSWENEYLTLESALANNTNQSRFETKLKTYINLEPK